MPKGAINMALVDETVQAFRALYEREHIPPTVRELADELGLRSSSTAQERLRKAIAAGRIERRQIGSWRSYKLSEGA